MGNEKLTEWKELCSGCKTYYTVKNGIWDTCPACDGLGNAKADSSDSEKSDYVDLRQRWKLNAR